MSTVEANVEIPGDPVPEPGDLELTQARDARVGAMTVRRMLPLRLRRSVGPWCFIDHYGPLDVDGVTGMNVPPHPHIGLQTVTWLLAGNVLHRDSLGSEQLIRPGQLNLMTSGRACLRASRRAARKQPWRLRHQRPARRAGRGAVAGDHVLPDRGRPAVGRRTAGWLHGSAAAGLRARHLRGDGAGRRRRHAAAAGPAALPADGPPRGGRGRPGRQHG